MLQIAITVVLGFLVLCGGWVCYLVGQVAAASESDLTVYQQQQRRLRLEKRYTSEWKP